MNHSKSVNLISRYTAFLLSTLLIGLNVSAQVLHNSEDYTHADTLRGSLRKERHFDVKHYKLRVRIDPKEKYLSGNNRIDFVPQEDLSVIQIDLFKNMQVDSILYRGHRQKYHREHNAVFITLDKLAEKGNRERLIFYYSGRPIIAKRPPWDGGFVFAKDGQGNSWIATTCQGIGASLWWPNKDHQSDEPDEGMEIQVIIPNGLMSVSNGRLQGKIALEDGYTAWHWKVRSPINNYDVALNIGDYISFGEKYKGLDLNYYVLRNHEDIAKEHFEEVKPMMDCFQEKFGEYPFKIDGYKLVETPFLGMEHQSAVAYGNEYQKGYLGNDLSATGIGLRWDFIIVHESGHEWFGNSITASDIADMWIHEGFTAYSESVYTECRWGYSDAQTYINGTSKNIKNDTPIIGDYGVNSEGSGDMYYKGALMLNTLRHLINDDTKWWQLIKAFAINYRHQIINTEDVINFFEEKTELSLRPIFYQYLKYTAIPTLEWAVKGKHLYYRWKVDVSDFKMPIDINLRENLTRLYPTQKWKKLRKTQKGEVQWLTDRFYISVKKREL